jgi:predicted transcriptional regulator
MLNKRHASVALLSLMIPVMGVAEDRIDATATLPDAKPGECYAKVIVPAKFEIKPEKVLVKPESETVEIIPATYDVLEKKILVKEAAKKLIAVPAVYRIENEEIEISPARNEWVTALGRRGIPASPALLAAAKTNGIDLENTSVGQCFAEYYVPAKFESKEKEVLVKEEAEEIKVAAAQFDKVDKVVTIKEESKKKVLVKAEYEVIEEKIEVEPAKAVWKKGSGPVSRIDNSTGDIMCLVQVPAKYKTIKKTVLKAPSKIDSVEIPAVTQAFSVSKLVSDATFDKIKIPAVYRKVNITTKVEDAKFVWRGAKVGGVGKATGNQICLKGIPARKKIIKKQVVDIPATVKEEVIPAVYKTIKVKKVATEAEERRTKIPAVYKTVEKRKKISKERLEWRRILCQTNMNADVNKRIQQALKDAGVYNGPIDGSIGGGTLKAVEKYQREKGLPTGGLTIQVLESLGVM